MRAQADSPSARGILVVHNLKGYALDRTRYRYLALRLGGPGPARPEECLPDTE